MSVEVLQMGGYGAYVWSCYGLTLAGLLYLAFAVRRSWQVELRHARRRAQAQTQTQAQTTAMGQEQRS